MSFKTFFKQKTVKFFIIIFAALLILSNVVVFGVSTIQYRRETKRQFEGYQEMMTHLLTLEDTQTAITYTTHYYHTQGIRIALYDQNEDLLYETGQPPQTSIKTPIYDNSDQVIAYVRYDDQHAIFARELSTALLIINGFSLILFLVSLRILYWYIKHSYTLLAEDLNHLSKDGHNFHFSDLEDISKRLNHLIHSEKQLRDQQKDYTKRLAHDLKTPLTVMKAYLEGVQLKQIKFDGSIINDLLEEIKQMEKMMPRFMVDDPSLDIRSQDLHTMIASTIHRFQALYQNKDIKVKKDIDPFTIDMAYIDAKRLIENLLANAYHYSDQGQSIHIILDAKNKALTIKDQGIGMSEETLKRIQEGPYRAKEAFEHYPIGSGMGMQIVYEIINRMGYTISIDSRLHQGTTIIIYF